MAEALVVNVLSNLALPASKMLLKEMKKNGEVVKEIGNLKRSLESIHAVLADADEKQMTEKHIKVWVERLKEVCYDVEDLLDEWRTARLKSEVDRASLGWFSRRVSTVLKLMKRPSDSFTCTYCSEIKKINERLDCIAKDKDRYHLVSRENLQPSRRPESTSFIQVSQLHGRDEDKKQLISYLFRDNRDHREMIKTISVVGKGGLGKTALAQLIYNDGRVKRHFDERIWVCVSNGFDVIRVAKAILQSIDDPRRRSTENLDSLQLQILLKNICFSVEGKKVLLVLDDVWTDVSGNWEALKEALRPAARGSSILVTTQKVTAAEAIKSFCVFLLSELSDDACWNIIRQEAFFGNSYGERFRISEDTGRKIAEKCKGLSLAAKILGGVLRSKKTRRDWEQVLESTAGSSWTFVQKNVVASLLLSYYDLPSATKRCFLYSSIFPKGGHFMEKDGLIRKWMAQGYLDSSSNPELEEIGAEYFELLVARSFFRQKVINGRVGASMDDMVVDFARVFMGKEFSSKADVHSYGDQTKMRHLYSTDYPNSFPESLWSLTISGKSFQPRRNRGLRRLCIQSKYLRSLDFIHACNVKEFPDEGGWTLMHLRLLNLSGGSFKTLPDSISELCNLQTLYLQDCYSLEKLPKKMKRMVSLRYLDTTGCPKIRYYPKGIRKLTSLRPLRGTVVRVGQGTKKFRMGDLKDLYHLRSLVLIFPDTWGRTDFYEAKQAPLRYMEHLKDLELITNSRDIHSALIRALDPPVTTNVMSFQRYLGKH